MKSETPSTLCTEEYLDQHLFYVFYFSYLFIYKWIPNEREKEIEREQIFFCSKIFFFRIFFSLNNSNERSEHKKV